LQLIDDQLGLLEGCIGKSNCYQDRKAEFDRETAKTLKFEL
jgi:hypothetical protein